MSGPKRDSKKRQMPTADDLAGTPILSNDDAEKIAGRGTVRTRGVKARGGGSAPRGGNIPPTADDLAGTPVLFEDSP
jgi:hypothetical protein